MAQVGAVGDVWELTTVCRYGGQAGLNKTHWKVTFAVGSPDAADTANEMCTQVQPNYVDYLSDQAKFKGITWQKIHPLPVADAFVVAPNQTGARADVIALPTQVSGILTKRTGLASRANRGRIYLPFWQEDDNDSPTIPNAGALSFMAAVAGAYETTHVLAVAGGSITLQPVIWHRGPRTTTPITSVVPRVYWATQRRRSFVNQRDDALIAAAL